MNLLWLLPLALLLAVGIYAIYHRRAVGEAPVFANYWREVLKIEVKDIRVARLDYGDDPMQYLLICEPKVGVTRREVIFHIHGGGWRFGRPDFFLQHAQLFCSWGYTVVLPCHRKTPKFKAPALREDTTLAYRATLNYLDEVDRSEDSIILSGVSSGGNLTGLLLYDQETATREKFDLSRVVGAMFFGAPLDLSGMKWSTVLRSYAGSRRRDHFRRASPISFLHDNSPKLPVLGVHGTHDAIVQRAAGTNFYDRLEALHPGSTEQILLEGGRHLSPVAWAHEAGALRDRVRKWLAELGVGASVGDQTGKVWD